MAQGTTYHIKFVLEPQGKKALREVEQKITAKLDEIDAKLSNYRDDSEISKINQNETTDWLTASPELINLLVISKTVYAKSDGCFDLTVKPLFDLWGFSKHEPKVPDQSAIDALKPHIGMNLLEIDPASQRLRKLDAKLKIDLAAIAQGYSVGAIAQLLEAEGIHDYMAEIGGEMMVRGNKADGKPWRIGIESPATQARELYKAVGIDSPTAKAVMTAGTYRNYFEENGQSYSHILNPKSGRPVTHHLLSVTIIHDDPSWADAWDTALLCMGEEAAMKTIESENLGGLLLYDKDGKLQEYKSRAFTYQ
jgi:FAD:protein FMN transferase